ncbi:DNA primase [Nocardioides sp. TRM66260-LWL]|uniref:DNA primase n=1 Tax=Nocardioides sp. TRM66260-LWL TaxID=2874478 RepID=UPI001CC3604D|nr:DNA primase [Nocardioides sp. TRM66260-LWL]MBZ5735837.1 DNA primase [Nocardioides sp. TRM66260-LWL]
MAGRIREQSIAEVREKARIDDVVAQYVTLRNAGGGSLKGLCPFHDEKSPSFHVTPSRGFYHCFGCQAGGDVISFVMEIDGLTFAEAVERLAEKSGVQLQRDESGDDAPAHRGPQRSRLVDAHRQAQEFYAEQLATPDALTARQFLDQRGFDQAAAQRFGVGFSPRDGEALVRHLRGRGFSTDELVAAGLAAVGRSPYDRFRSRLMWPIREATGDTIGFGARRLFDDDRVEAKYLNTSETAIYKKSQVLYGIDLARREIARGSQAVIVEGYTDVMACHLAGIGTAVATCGTAFGDEHARVLRRFLADHQEFRGEVIFTFDGDAAGQKAALRAFGGDQNFVSQTYVAVEPGGLDPCDLRMQQGDEAVRDLIARRVPLYRFVLGNVVGRHDLDRADGRVDALREGARLVSSVRDRSKVDAFARELAQLVGVDPDEARAEVRRAAARQAKQGSGAGTGTGQPARETVVRGGASPEAPGEQPVPRREGPDLRDPRFTLEREVLKLLLQHPAALARSQAQAGVDDFTHPTCRAVWELVEAAGGPAAAASDPTWGARLRDAATGRPEVSSAISALGVEPVLTAREPDEHYAEQHVVRLLELTVLRRIAEVKSRLQRTNPVDQPDVYNRMFGELAALEQHRRTLRDHIVGVE